MDPSTIQLDWERTFEALMIVIVLAFIIERALAVLFETELFIRYVDKPGTKALIASVVSIIVCFVWKIDALSMILGTGGTIKAGYFITGFVIAGGSKASIKLFHDVLNVKATAYDMRDEIQAEKAADDATAHKDRAIAHVSYSAAAAAADRADRAARTARRIADRSGSGAAATSAQRAEDAARVALERARALKTPQKTNTA